jgi:hypothetical protein
MVYLLNDYTYGLVKFQLLSLSSSAKDGTSLYAPDN